jgi:mRNA interferase RelE/StbE
LAYNVKWQEKVIEDLKNLDKQNAKAIMERVKIYLSQDPISLGKPLKGMFKGLFRYRYGDYRIIYALDRKAKNILILRIGHRKDIYN